MRQERASSRKQATKVFFIPFEKKESSTSLAEKTKHILAASKLGGFIQNKNLVALKQHFGEKGNEGFIKPEVTKVVVDYVKKKGARPLVVETNTLYQGQRANSYDHLMLAYDHGFSIEKLGAPVVIMDGLYGQNQHPVSIPGTHFKSVQVVGDIPFFDCIIVLSHVKGHMMSGMGGAIKNLAMGFSSRAGKLAQHVDFKPQFDHALCVRCELCGSYCPQGAITLAEDRMQVDLERCIGCGECHIACRSGAISFQWGEDTRTFQEKMAEYALGAVIGHKGKTFFLNYADHITQQCDCWGGDNPVRFPNIGLFASEDPVAVDRACIDMAKEVVGKDVFHELWPKINALVQIEHAEKIGLGSQEYEIVRL